MSTSLHLLLGIKTDPIEYRYSYPWLFRLAAEEGVEYIQLGSTVALYLLPDDFLHWLREQAEKAGVRIYSWKSRCAKHGAPHRSTLPLLLLPLPCLPCMRIFWCWVPAVSIVRGRRSGRIIGGWCRRCVTGFGSASLVVLFDIVEEKLAMAKELGFAHAYHAFHRAPEEVIASLTEGQGAHVCLEAAGVPQTLLQACACARRGGRVVVLGKSVVIIGLGPRGDRR